MNKPVYLSQAILDLSKIIMYELHYDYMKPKYGDNLQLCYMDTDSLVYRIKTEDFYTEIRDDVEERFDTSGYCDNHPLPVGFNKKVIRLMKDELGGAIMTEFVALRPKLYSYRKLDGAEDRKCKRIKKCVVKKTLTFDDYKNCLFNPMRTGFASEATGPDAIDRSQLMFRSTKHEVHTIEVSKVALNRDDDKRIAKKDGISTLARGHKSLSWSPILGELSLIYKLIKEGKRKLARRFNLSYRYIDDLISFNNKRFKEFISDIYPKELTISETTESTSVASYLDLLFIRDNSNNITTKLYDKRDTFGFHIVNFPFMSNSIPSTPAYGVYASQLICYARRCSNNSDFLSHHRALVTRLLSQGYKVNRLSNTFKKFYGRHTDLVGQYKKSVCQMFADSIS